MKKLLAIGALAAAFALPASAATIPTVPVYMHDPGCHWFKQHGKYVTHMTVRGPVKLANYDEATLIVKGPHGTARDAVGHTMVLRRGVYHITMVRQASDDNHLTLTVR